jgi:membrane-associated phospholipid phosphatase
VRRILAGQLLALTLTAPVAGAQPADTTKVSTAPLFTSTDAYVAGGFTLMTIAMFPLDKELANRLQNPTTQANRFMKQQATFFRTIAVPGAVIIGGSLYAVGKIGGNDRMADLGLHGTEAIFIGEGTAYILKGLGGRARPFQGIDHPHDFKLGRGFRQKDYRSFPSGHTIAGFAAAAAVTSETNRWWPQSTWYVAPVMYGGATLIGFSRMYNNKHWASDVVMGAAIGTFAGLKVVRYHHSHPNNRIDRWLLSGSLVPTDTGGWALAWSVAPSASGGTRPW